MENLWKKLVWEKHEGEEEFFLFTARAVSHKFIIKRNIEKVSDEAKREK